MLLDVPASSISDYRSAGGYEAPADGAPHLLDAVSAAGLRGRGGAWFPVGRKWLTALAQAGPRVLVANGAEDEPGSLKDRYLMATAPHLVLDGALLAARALGADTVRLYVNEHADLARDALERALAEAADLTSGIDVAVVAAPATYVAGEDSAAVEFLETGTAQPRNKPPYPATAGLHGRPTVVNNVETLAHVAWIARAGVGAFRAHGTPATPGTMLVTIPAECANPGVYEVEIGAYLDEVLAGVGGGFVAGPARGVQVGGPASGWLSEWHVALDPEAVSAAGSTLGCGAVRVLPAGHCAVDAVVSTSEFFAREQCGKCPPCRMATQFIHRAAAGLAQNKGTTAAQLDAAPTLVAQVRDRTACSLVSFPLSPLTTAREVFAGDFAAHLAGEDCGLVHRRRSLSIEGT
ncbi:MAG TPA: NADH-ubiquinone oxidoreductase-F iron-sulfur binding region domain-containing protein [Sporichthyaceae bacterium]|jgi:NADH-quinone oxidoreductase subunit F|nr:NADH-ubiquinone oxidoreductase-F iron-sulfur binding region domain-containing protein [Sporichthyaceae bacterium]